MSSFCRITGLARNLPKPTYFPLLPPISPAEAKKLCRITGKSNDAHNFSPIISFAKPIKFDGVKGCKITVHKEINHRYVQPVYERNNDNEKTIEHMLDIISKMKTIKGNNRLTDKKKEYYYEITEYHMTIVVDSNMEEAIRTGEFDYIHMAKDKKHINVKTNNGRIIKLLVNIMPKGEIEENDNVYHGEGPTQEVIDRQQKVLDENNKRKQNTLARKKIFEDKERKAEEDEKRATTRPIPKRPRIKFDPKKRAEKLAKMEQMMREQERNKAIVLPKVDFTCKVDPDEQIRYEKMLEDIQEAQVTSKSLIAIGGGEGFDWVEADKAESAGFDWDCFPHEEWIDPAEVEATTVTIDDVVSFKEVISIDVVVSIETVDPVKGPSNDFLKLVESIPKPELKCVEKVADSIKKFKCQDQLAQVNDIGKITENLSSAKAGFMVKKGDQVVFVAREDLKGDERDVISGAMVMIDGQEKFVTGMMVKDTFIPGQAFLTTKGNKFVPGQTVGGTDKETEFLPGVYVTDENGKTNFVAGQSILAKDGTTTFVAGQVMDKGDNNRTFVPGQTIITEDGPKFVPGEIQKYLYGEEEFVPGIAVKSGEGERFVPGQTFQTEDGNLSFTPGQIVHTVEGPSFVPGKTFVTPEGEKKFVKGDIIETEEGGLKFQKRDIIVPSFKDDSIIPHEDLHPLAVAGKRVAGFIVHPTNTENIKAGETLYGDMVETKDNVQFYITGKLPTELPKDGKIISGELIVEETQQRFIPGKMLKTDDGEKFVPGQLVRTNHGEEFVPGQIVETSEGPKFVPGQLVDTLEGEKFVPGQVIVEADGPKFVPGQIIQTKNGATFIPGQMMYTDEGQKFVPGQLVETAKGPRFVPGQVVETSEGPKFVPGTVIETEDGLKYVPQEASEVEDDIEISFQGYDVTPEELRLLAYHPIDFSPHTIQLEDEGLIDSATLKKLAVDSMVIHGRTPSPTKDKKKKKKKRARVQLDAPEEDEIEVEEVDEGTNKIEILKRLIKANNTVSNVKKERELRRLIQLLNLNEEENTMNIQTSAMSFILSAFDEKADAIKSYFQNDEKLLKTILTQVGDLDNVTRNDQVKKQLRNAIQKVITRKCDKEINNLIQRIAKDPESILSDAKTLLLLTEAVGVVCVTGDVEVASMLEKFISEPSNPDSLREDEDVLSVLRQLIVLHRISETNKNVIDALQDLQMDPEGVKNKKRIRKLIKIADMLLKKPKEEDGKFDIRHVASSKDIPSAIFDQIKEDNDEADEFMKSLPDELFETIMRDNRCNDSIIQTLGGKNTEKFKAEMEKFKKGMAVVIVKENVQAVIPRTYARSVCYGIMPYILIDEEGFKFFERGLTGRKLAPHRIIQNTWFKDDSYYIHYHGQVWAFLFRKFLLSFTLSIHIRWLKGQ